MNQGGKEGAFLWNQCIWSVGEDPIRRESANYWGSSEPMDLLVPLQLPHSHPFPGYRKLSQGFWSMRLGCGSESITGHNGTPKRHTWTAGDAEAGTQVTLNLEPIIRRDCYMTQQTVHTAVISVYSKIPMAQVKWPHPFSLLKFPPALRNLLLVSSQQMLFVSPHSSHASFRNT